MAARKVAGQTTGRRGNATSFSTPLAVAEEALIEAQARFDRAAHKRIADVDAAERAFVAELSSVRQHLRLTTASISGVALHGAP